MATSTQSRKLFGRKPDLDYLLKRAGDNGLTSIVARPQAGKTWLLRQFTDSLSSSSEYLVGYAESTGQYADLLRRSLQDLYTRWLSNSSYLEQARSLWTRHKKNLTTQFGKTVGSALGRVLEASTYAKGLSSSIDGYFNGLHQVNRDLQSGGITLPVLDYDQARDLLLLLDRLSAGKQRAVLILDAFEQGEGTEVEAATLAKFLSHLDEWPECHMFLAMREPEGSEKETTALKCARELSQASVAAEIWHLPDLHLEDDLPECDILLYYLRDKVPATRNVEDERLLEMIGGYAGVVGRWVEAQDIRAQAPKDEADLRRLAEDANALRYRELETLLLKLQAENQAHFLFGVRLALLPELQSSAVFELYRDILVADRQESPVPSLQACGLLHADDNDPEAPTYGHTARYESVRRLICTESRFKPHARQEAQVMSIKLASLVTEAVDEAAPHLVALLWMRSIGSEIGLPECYQGLCEAAATLCLGLNLATQPESVLQASTLVSQHPGVGSLLAMAMCNMLHVATRENQLERRDALLNGLRALATAQPEQAGVLEPLARGLCIAIDDAKRKEDLTTRDALLDEVRALAAAYLQHGDIQGQLASALYNTLNDAQDEDDLERRDALLDELRDLAKAHSELPAVQEKLAKSLYNTCCDVREADPLRCDALLDELHALGAAYPEHTRIQEILAGGLANACLDKTLDKDADRCEELLDELRVLAGANSESVLVQERLAGCLFNLLNAAKQENDLLQHDALLDELQKLASTYADHMGVQEQLAKALFNAVIDAAEDGDNDRGDTSLDKLRELGAAHPKHPALMESLAKGLFTRLQHAIQESDRELGSTLLHELRGLIPKLTDSPHAKQIRTFLDRLDDM